MAARRKRGSQEGGKKERGEERLSEDFWNSFEVELKGDSKWKKKRSENGEKLPPSFVPSDHLRAHTQVFSLILNHYHDIGYPLQWQRLLPNSS
jgi:hypothetical protein